MSSTEKVIKVTVARLTSKWGPITPCSGKTWAECITVIDGRKVLWFNDATGSTRLDWI